MENSDTRNQSTTNDEIEFDEDVLSEVEWMRSEYLHGDNSALLIALLNCCNLKHSPMPNWVSSAVHNAIEQWAYYEKKTLDEAFDVVKPKGFNLNAARKKIDIGVDVYLRVRTLNENGEAIDDGLFDRVGKAFGISGSSAKKYFYERKNGKVHPPYVPFAGRNSKKI